MGRSRATSPGAAAPPAQEKGSLVEGLRIIGRGVRQQPAWFALAVAGAFVYGVMQVALSAAIGWCVEHVVTPAVDQHAVTRAGLLTILGVIAAVVVTNVAGVIVRRVAGGLAYYNLAADYRRQVTRQYLRLPLAWHHRHPSGQLLSNANADVEATWQVFMPLPMAIGVLVMLAVAGAQMVLLDPLVALIGFLVFPGLFAANLLFQRAMSPRATKVQRLRAEVSEVAHESFEAGLVVKSMGREDQEGARFAAATHELRDAAIDMGRTRGTFDPVIEAIPQLGTLAVLSVGTLQVARGHLSTAEVVQVAYLFTIMAMPVRALGWVLSELPRTVVGWERVRAVLDATGAMEHGTARLTGEGPAEVRLADATYRYDTGDHEDLGSPAPAPGHPSSSPPGGGDERAALREVTVTVPRGRTTALVGPTGAGKSTLASVALRLVDPQEGTVRIDGTDVRELAAGEIPAAAALVAQETFMFDDTVRGNVALDLDVTDEHVWDALRVARADAFVAALPRGLDTLVGERGGSLSGGQRQRIALARAIIRAPRLLVLDDATSAVDPAVEQAILHNLRTARAGTTVLVIAYRMATITLADHVVFLVGGRVVDEGTHVELMGRCEGYRELVTAYARDAAEREEAAR